MTAVLSNQAAVAAPKRSQGVWAASWRRLKSDKVGVFSMVVVALSLLLVLAAGLGLVARDWQKDFGLPADTLKGGLCCSGMYDLYPVSLSARAGYVKFTPETIEKLSPQRHLDKLVAPVIVAHGTLETPEFQRQNRDFAAAVKAAGKPVTLLVAEGYNHFEIAEAIGNPLSLLGSAVLEMMKIE